MKRSGFKPKYPRRPVKVYEVHTPRARAVAVSDGKARMVVPVPKLDLVRDEGYRRLVASLPCICCGSAGRSQAAHPNTGKGLAMKADDRECFPLCTVGASDCHGAFDQRAMFTKEQRRELEPLWANQTRMLLRAMAHGDASIRTVVDRVIGWASTGRRGGTG